MGWLRYLKHDYATAAEFDSIDSKIDNIRRIERSRQQDLSLQLDAALDELAKTQLLVQALVETCVAKGMMSRQDLVDQMTRLDLLDGIADGKMNSEPEKKNPFQIRT